MSEQTIRELVQEDQALHRADNSETLDAVCAALDVVWPAMPDQLAREFWEALTAELQKGPRP